MALATALQQKSQLLVLSHRVSQFSRDTVQRSASLLVTEHDFLVHTSTRRMRAAFQQLQTRVLWTVQAAMSK